MIGKEMKAKVRHEDVIARSGPKQITPYKKKKCEVSEGMLLPMLHYNLRYKADIL